MHRTSEVPDDDGMRAVAQYAAITGQRYERLLDELRQTLAWLEAAARLTHPCSDGLPVSIIAPAYVGSDTRITRTDEVLVTVSSADLRRAYDHLMRLAEPDARPSAQIIPFGR